MLRDSLVVDLGPSEVDPTRAFRLQRHITPQVHSAVGKREERVDTPLRGKYSRARFPRGPVHDCALDATLRAAAARNAGAGAAPLKILPQDLREKARRHRSPYAIVFVVDNSWSMHVETTVERTKGAVLDFLKDASTYHDKVGLIAFRHNRIPDATVCLPLTNSYSLATERLRRIPLSGTTPLPDGFRKALRLLRQERGKYHNALPVIVAITDGLPNIPLQRGGDPYEDIVKLCHHIRRSGVSLIVIDTEPSGSAAGRSNCTQMAELSKGICLPLSALSRAKLEETLFMARHGARPSG